MCTYRNILNPHKGLRGSGALHGTGIVGALTLSCQMLINCTILIFEECGLFTAFFFFPFIRVKDLTGSLHVPPGEEACETTCSRNVVIPLNRSDNRELQS